MKSDILDRIVAARVVQHCLVRSGPRPAHEVPRLLRRDARRKAACGPVGRLSAEWYQSACGGALGGVLHEAVLLTGVLPSLSGGALKRSAARLSGVAQYCCLVVLSE